MPEAITCNKNSNRNPSPKRITLFAGLVNVISLSLSSILLTVFYNSWEGTQRGGYTISVTQGFLVMFGIGLLFSFIATPLQLWILRRFVAKPKMRPWICAIQWFGVQWGITLILSLLLFPVYILTFFILIPIPYLIALFPFQLPGAIAVYRCIRNH